MSKYGNNNQIRYNIGFDFDKTTLASLKQELQSLQNLSPQDIMKVNSNFGLGEAKKQLNEIRKSASEVQNAITTAFNPKLESLNITKLQAELDKINIGKIYEDFSKAGPVGQQAFDKISSSVMKTNLQLKQSHTLIQSLGTTITNTIKWGIASGAVDRVTGSVQKAWNYTKALDTSLNDIRIVTGKSSEEMEKFAKTANKAAQNLGSNTKEYTNASLIYYQQGLDDAETKARTDVTLKAANVTGQTGQEVSEQLTAIWNGYKVNAAEAELYIDKVAKVAATTAADLEEMATGMSKVASAANSAGVDIDQLNGMLSTVISVTREAPETIGTSFKTIFARLGDLEAGKTDEDGVDLGNISGQLQQLGVQILDETGNMRNMGDIIEDLAGKWEGWTAAQRQAVAVAVAGKMQYSRLISLFDNWDMYTQAVENSKNATGELQKQQDIYMERTAAHLKQLEAAKERIFDSLVDNKGINGLIDTFTGLTNGVANFIESLGGGGNALLTFGSIGMKVFGNQIAGGINTFINNLKISKDNIKQLETQLKVLETMQKGIVKETGKEDVGLAARIAYKEKMKNNFSSLTPQQVQQGNDLIDEYGQKVSEQAGIEETRKQALQFIQELHRETNKGASDLSQETLEKSLADSSKEYDKYLDNWIKLDTQMDKYKASLENLEKAQKDYNKAIASDDKDKQAEATANYRKEIEKLKTNLTEVANRKDIGESQRENAENALNELKGTKTISSNKMQAAVKKSTQAMNEIFDDVQRRSEIVSDAISNEATQAGERVRLEVEQAKDEIDKFFESSKREQFITDMTKMVAGFGQLASAVSAITNLKDIWTNEDLTIGEQILQTVMMLSTTLPMMASGWSSVKQGITSIGEIIPEVKEKIITLALAKKAGGAAATGATGPTMGLASALWTLLAPLAPVLIAIVAVTGAAIALTKAYNKDADAAKKDAEAAANAKKAYEETETAASNLKSSLENYSKAIKNIQNLTKGTKEHKQAIVEANQEVIELLNNYKELNKYVTRTEDGLLQISDEGMDAVLEEQLKRQYQTQIDYLDKQAQALRSQTKSDTTNYRRSTDVDFNTNLGVYRDLGRYGDSFETQQKYRIRETGNIDLQNRPKYKQDDGSISTLNSASFWSEKEQKEILVPAIYELTDDIKKIVGDNVSSAKDGVIDIFNEFDGDEAEKVLKDIYNQQGKFLGKFDDATDATIYGQAAYEANAYQYSQENKALSGDHIPDNIINSIADYMRENDLQQIGEIDLANIEEVTNASSELQIAIRENVKPLSDMAQKINESKDAQKLLAEQATDAYLKMKNIVDDDGKMTVNEILIERIMNNKGGVVVSEDEANARREEEKKSLELGLTGGYTKETFDKAKKYYENTYGVKLEQDGFNKWLTVNDKGIGDMAKFDVLSADGTRTEGKPIKINDLMNEYFKNGEREDRAKEAKDASKEAEKRLNNIANQFNFSKGGNESSLNKILASSYVGENGAVEIFKDDTMLTQADAKEISEKLTGIDKNTLAEALGYSGENIDEFYNKFKAQIEGRAKKSDAEVFSEQINSTVEDASKVRESLTSGDLTFDNAKDNGDLKNLRSEAENLLKIFPDLQAEVDILNKDALVGSEDWAAALYKIQETVENFKLDNMAKQSNEAIEKMRQWLKKAQQEDGTINLDFELDDQNFQELMSNIVDKSYAVDVEIHAQAEEAFETFEDSINNMSEQAAKIGENYVVAASDVRELNNVFPGIIENMQAVGDGTVKLNQQVVQSAMSSAEAEMQASAQSTLNQLQNQATLLRGRAASYEAMAVIAEQLAQSDTATEEQKNQLLNQLDEIQTQNDELMSNNEMNNQQRVAQDAFNQGQTTAKNWNAAYQSAADSAIAFARTAAQAHQVAVTGQGNVSKDFNFNYQGQNAQSSEAATVASLKDAVAGASSSQDWQNVANSFRNAATSARAQANDIEGMIAQIGARSIEAGKGLSNVASGKGANPKKGSSKKEKDPDIMDNVEDKTDPYHDVNIQLELIDANLKKLQSQQDKFFGTKLIDNYNKQLTQLNKKIDTTKEKLAIANGEKAKLASELTSKGATFNADGTIANYEQLYMNQLAAVNSVIDHYNSLSAEAQEGYKDTVEAAKKDFEKFKESLSEYDDTVSSIIPGLEQDIQDAIDEKIEIQIEKFNMEIELRLDMAEAERDWNEFKKKIIDGIKDDDIFGNAEARLEDIWSYYNDAGNGIVQAGTRHLEDILAELRQMDSSGWSDVYGDNRSQALEDLKNYYEQLMQDLEDVRDLQEEIHDSYLDMMDEAQDKFDDQVKMYQQVHDLIEHDTKLLQLINGDKVFVNLDKYYDKAQKNYNQQLDFQRGQVKLWADQMDRIADKTSEEWLKARDNWIAATNDLNSTLEEAIENATDKWENAIDAIIDKMQKALTNGKGMDYVEEEWKLRNENADRYLDTINRTYETQKLANKYQEAINKTDNPAAQQKLKDLMKEQVDLLEKKDRVTKYDIERANKLYEIHLKELALEEAQQNKSTMRLRRDSQGNYRYEFVANDDDIDAQKQELEDMRNSLYNFDKDHLKEIREQSLQDYQDYIDRRKEIMMEYANDKQKQEEMLALLDQQYNELAYQDYDDLMTARVNLTDSAITDLAALYNMNIEDFDAMTEAEKDKLLTDLVPTWDVALQDMLEAFAGPEGFTTLAKDAMADLDQTTLDYEEDLKNLQDSASVSFDEIGEGIDNVINQTEWLIQDNNELLDGYEQAIMAMEDLIGKLDTIIARYKTAQAEAKAAVQAAYEYWAMENEKAARAAQQEEAARQAAAGYGGNSSGGSGGNAGGSGGGPGNGGGNYTVVKNDTLSGLAQRFGGSSARWTEIYNSNKDTIDNTARQRGLSGGGHWIFPGQQLYIPFRSGGYTGDWEGTDGKLGILHQKELVLNAADTKNILDAVDITRKVADSINMNMLSRIGQLTSSTIAPKTETAAEVLEQNVHIDATFPGVQDAQEIKDALNNLVNIASQRANRKRI